MERSLKEYEEVFKEIFSLYKDAPLTAILTSLEIEKQIDREIIRMVEENRRAREEWVKKIIEEGKKEGIIITENAAKEMLKKVDEGKDEIRRSIDKAREELNKAKSDITSAINESNKNLKNYFGNEAEVLKNALKEHDENTNNKIDKVEESLKKYFDDKFLQQYVDILKLSSKIKEELENVVKEYGDRIGGDIAKFAIYFDKFNEKLFETLGEIEKVIKTEGKSTRGHVTRWSKKIIYDKLKELEENYQALSQSVKGIPEIYERIQEYGKVLEKIFPIDQSKEDPFQRKLGEYGI